MTGEMVMPTFADRDVGYWKGIAPQIVGDESYLIRPNYPAMFGLLEKMTAAGLEVTLAPWDVYQGPCIVVDETDLRIWYGVGRYEDCDECVHPHKIYVGTPAWEVTRGTFGGPMAVIYAAWDGDDDVIQFVRGELSNARP